MGRVPSSGRCGETLDELRSLLEPLVWRSREGFHEDGLRITIYLRVHGARPGDVSTNVSE